VEKEKHGDKSILKFMSTPRLG